MSDDETHRRDGHEYRVASDEESPDVNGRETIVAPGGGRTTPFHVGRRLGPLVAVAVMGHLACQSLSDGAKSDFSTAYTCPADRVEARARPDLHPSDFMSRAARKTPPREIASDPERLRMWQEREDRPRTYADTYHSIYEVRGCGHQALYECGHASRGSSTSWICSERTAPPTSAPTGPPTVPPTVPPLEPPR